MEWNRNQLRAGPRRERRARGEHGGPPERIAWLAPSIRLSPGGMIPISEKSSGGALVDWVPEGHNRKYTEPVAMSIRIAATPSAWAFDFARLIGRWRNRIRARVPLGIRTASSWAARKSTSCPLGTAVIVGGTDN